jgi:general secretion pathway protein A
MYLDFYHLKEKPFPISSGLKFFFLGSGHKEALTALTEGVSQRKGLMTVLAEFGLGKTTLIQAFLKEASQDNVKIIQLLNSNISFEELQLFLCRELGLVDENNGQPGLSYQLLQGLRRAYKAGTSVVLLIDEAHNMPEETLEGLRLVSNPDASLEETLQIVFIGQPVFWETIGHYDLRQLKQRIGKTITLSPLTSAESRGYITLRIERAGGQVNAVFTRGALDKIIHQAGGNPWKINILCNNVLISGYEQAQKPIPVKTVKQVIRRPQATKTINYFSWVISFTGVILILLGWLVLDRPYFSLKRQFRLPEINQEESGRVITDKVIEKLSVPSDPMIKPPEEKEFKRPFVLPASRGPVKEDAPPSSSILSGTEILKSPLRSEKKLPLNDRNQKPLSTSSNSKRDPLPVLKNPPVRAVRVVKKGDNFSRLVEEVYGFSNQVLWDYVRKYNPTIKDVRKIRIGEKIVFPELKKGKQKNG